MSKKTLILNGSPRTAGDTAQLLGLVTERLSGEWKRVDAYRCNISPCVDCRYCWENDGCVIDDEMQEVYRYLKECDNVIIASPIYFSELPGPLLSVGSRLQALYCARHFRNTELVKKPKRGAVILVGGGDGSAEKASGTARTLLRQMNCREIHGTVVSHNTNEAPAMQDEEARRGVESVIEFLNGEE